MSFRLPFLAALPALGVWLTYAGTAGAADDDDEKPKAQAVVRPAEIHTDPQTGAQTVLVPPGCTANTRKNGQLVVLCPYKEPGAEPHSHYDRKWYGWEILLVDGGAFLTGALLLATESQPAQGIGATVMVSGYLLGGPTVHWSNGQIGKGFGSLGIRIGAPVVGGIVGLGVGALTLAGGCSGDCGDHLLLGAAFGVAFGATAAVAIDVAALARKRVLVQDEPPKQGKIQWQPIGGYDPKRQTATIGIGGTF